MEYLEQISGYITLEFTLLALSIGFALNFLMALSAMRSRKSLPSKPMINTGDHSELFNSIESKISVLQQDITESKQSITQLKQKLPRTSLVRFNPFRDSGVGGNQSFSLAQVDAHGNGSVITHLFSREMSRVSAITRRKASTART